MGVQEEVFRFLLFSHFNNFFYSFYSEHSSVAVYIFDLQINIGALCKTRFRVALWEDISFKNVFMWGAWVA